MAPKIEFAANVEPPEGSEEILQKLFPNYQKILVKKEFAEGLGGSWVYLVERFKRAGSEPDVEDEFRDSPVVVKIASAGVIEKEWAAYRTYIRNTFPNENIAQIESEPVSVKGSSLSGLYYALAGSGVFPTQSLIDYAFEAAMSKQVAPKDIERVVDRLSRIISNVALNKSNNKQDLSVRASYDRILPVNLLVRPTTLSSDAKYEEVSPEERPEIKFKSEDDPPVFVRLKNFLITKIDPKHRTITLNVADPGQAAAPTSTSYYARLKFKTSADMDDFIDTQPQPFAEGERVVLIEGQVLETRESAWLKEVQKFLPDEQFALDQSQVGLSGGRLLLPNPLQNLETDILTETPVRAVKSFVHGDLNLENILVDPDVNDVRLIDFAEARWDHILHDFLRFEAEVVTKLIAPIMAKKGIPLERLHLFYQQLHCATFHDPLMATRSPDAALEIPFLMLKTMRKAAREQGLIQLDKYPQYYNCLTIYLLGTLKFRNLNQAPDSQKPWPKEVAFWTAASVQEIVLLGPQSLVTCADKPPLEKLACLISAHARPILMGANVIALSFTLLLFYPDFLEEVQGRLGLTPTPPIVGPPPTPPPPCPPAMTLIPATSARDKQFCSHVTPVSYAEYADCVEEGACEPPCAAYTSSGCEGKVELEKLVRDSPQAPVVWIRLEDARNYCAFLEANVWQGDTDVWEGGLPEDAAWEQAMDYLIQEQLPEPPTIWEWTAQAGDAGNQQVMILRNSLYLSKDRPLAHGHEDVGFRCVSNVRPK